MADIDESTAFTIYLEGHEAHRGNVVASAFLAKASKIILVLNRLERTFLDERVRQTDFEIIGADKRNPTTLSLKPVPRSEGYEPSAAFRWGLNQIDLVGRGQEPDERISSDLAFDLHDLASKRGEFDYRAFWINGFADAVRFDEEYAQNALKVARARLVREAPDGWKVGRSFGSVTGELKKVDDLESGHEFVIVPAVGADKITCTFPDELRDRMGQCLFKIVRVSGVLHYGETSPFPYLVNANEIEKIPQRRKTFAQMRGIFADRRPHKVEWDSLLDGR